VILRLTIPGAPGATFTEFELMETPTPKNESVRVTEPLNPLRLVIEIVVDAPEPLSNVIKLGLDETSKSPITREIVTVCVREPLVAVIVSA
jgi:hypothetical protein